MTESRDKSRLCCEHGNEFSGFIKSVKFVINLLDPELFF